jgi:hypothetical protein
MNNNQGRLYLGMTGERFWGFAINIAQTGVVSDLIVVVNGEAMYHLQAWSI